MAGFRCLPSNQPPSARPAPRDSPSLPPHEACLALAGSLLIAAAFGAIRAATVHVWVDGGQGLRQGTWLTAVLWVVSLGVHLGYDYLLEGKGAQAGLGSASLLLYFGVTYTIQRLILQARAQRITGSRPRNAGVPTASR
jgi:hypothetical protein